MPPLPVDSTPPNIPGGAAQSTNQAAAASILAKYRDLALIILDTRSISELTAVEQELRSLGVTPVVIHEPNVMLGWASQSAILRAQGNPRVRLATGSAVPVTHQAFAQLTDNGRKGVAFFNSVTSGEIVKHVTPSNNKVEFVERVLLPPPPAGPTGKISADHHTNWPNDEFTGRVALSVFFVESNGAIDANSYTWPNGLYSDLYNTILRIEDACFWWSDRAQAHGRQILWSITWYTHYHQGAQFQCVQQPYEPVHHAISDNHLWINPIMACLGYNQPSVFDRVRAFNDQRRTSSGAQNAYSAFIVYNPTGIAPSAFTDGGTAQAYLGGPWTDMLFDNGGYSPNDDAAIFAHETGHIFWACDEYASFCGTYYPNCANCASGSGPRPNLLNTNCEASNCLNHSNFGCVMKYHTGPPDHAYINNLVCPHTRAQIGW